ncbi:MAG: mucoidy inhibitor MuiA family protein [Hyphomicrobiaceae bacterium]
MRFILPCIAFFLAAPGSVVFADTIKQTSQIENVTVFPSGAAVERTAKVQLQKGTHEIVIGDLPGQAVANTIRVEGQGTGAMVIGSVDTRRYMVTDADGTIGAKRKQLEDAIEAAGDRRAAIVGEIETAETKKQLISNLANLPNQPSPSAGNVVQAPDWIGVLTLISSEMAQVQREKLDGQKRLREIDKEISDLKKQLSGTTPKPVQRTEVKIFASAELPLDATFTIRYHVPSASWSALYEARLATGTKAKAPDLTLVRRASIRQRTGEDWSGVALTLSTTRPNLGASAPNLPVLNVDFERPRIIQPMAMNAPAPEADVGVAEESRKQNRARSMAKTQKPRRVVTAKPAQSIVANAPFQALFKIAGTVDVPATGAAKTVQLAENSIRPKLSIRTVPAVEAKAYLYAELTVPKGAPILPGQVSLFRDGTYVGRGTLPMIASQEKHKLGFGADDRVRVRHSVEADKRGETGLISAAKTDTRNYKITVKNLHERAIQVTVIDRMPVSANDDIKVNLLGPTKPTKQDLEDKRGILNWEKEIIPDAEQVVQFGYRVIWPAEKAIRYSR